LNCANLVSPNNLVREPTQPLMQLNPRQIVTQFAHLLQEELFPLLETASGPLSKQLQLVASVMAMLPLERLLSARRSSTGRPAKDRAALATAFLAKAVLNLPPRAI